MIKSRRWLNILIVTLSLFGLGFAFVKLFVDPQPTDPTSQYFIFSIIVISSIFLIISLFFALTENNPKSDLGDINEERSVRKDMIELIEDRRRRLVTVANANLCIGLLFTVIGLSLPILLFKDIHLTADSRLLYIQLVTRSGFIVLFITVAFFFFRIYRSVKEDITYLINEEINIFFKIEAIDLLEKYNKIDDKDLLIKVLDDFLKVDRNYKFGNGEANMRIKALENEVSENNTWIQQIISKLIKAD